MDCLLGGQKEAKMKLKKLLGMIAVAMAGVVAGYILCLRNYGLFGDDYDEDDFDDDFDDEFEDEEDRDKDKDAEKTETHYTDLRTAPHPSGEPAEDRITVEG